MLKHQTEALIVTHGDAATGIVSERKVVQAVARHGARALTVPVMDIMRTDQR